MRTRCVGGTNSWTDWAPQVFLRHWIQPRVTDSLVAKVQGKDCFLHSVSVIPIHHAVGRREVRCLGYHLGGAQVRPQVDKTEAKKKEIHRKLLSQIHFEFWFYKWATYNNEYSLGFKQYRFLNADNSMVAMCGGLAKMLTDVLLSLELLQRVWKGSLLEYRCPQ